MARRKRTPEVSTIVRPAVVAYARKQKPGGSEDGGEDGEDDAKPEEQSASATMKLQIEKPDEAPDRPTQTIDPATLREAVAEAPVRGRVDTVGMTDGGFGTPPEIPQPAAVIVIKGGAVEDPTHMPGPRDIPPGSPDDVASPPGHVPPGDSRSLRRRGGDHYEFALIYRQGNAVLSRHGVVGTRGVWRVVEYPTTSSASNAYAREASRFVTDGFSDYRE